MDLNMKAEKNGNEVVIVLNGELNTLTAPKLHSFIGEELQGEASLVLDFADCDFVSSAGLRVLLAVFKERKANKAAMALKNVGQNFMDVLENTGLDGVFDTI